MDYKDAIRTLFNETNALSVLSKGVCNGAFPDGPNGLISWSDWLIGLIEQLKGSDLDSGVTTLVIAAREFWEANNDASEESLLLDRALEPFSGKVPYSED